MKLTLEAVTVTVEGVQLDGARVANVESFGIAEDRKTLVVMVELADHRLACFQFCPGLPVTAHVVRE